MYALLWPDEDERAGNEGKCSSPYINNVPIIIEPT